MLLCTLLDRLETGGEGSASKRGRVKDSVNDILKALQSESDACNALGAQGHRSSRQADAQQERLTDRGKAASLSCVALSESEHDSMHLDACRLHNVAQGLASLNGSGKNQEGATEGPSSASPQGETSNDCRGRLRTKKMACLHSDGKQLQCSSTAGTSGEQSSKNASAMPVSEGDGSGAVEGSATTAASYYFNESSALGPEARMSLEDSGRRSMDSTSSTRSEVFGDRSPSNFASGGNEKHNGREEGILKTPHRERQERVEHDGEQSDDSRQVCSQNYRVASARRREQS